jgi:hypothetical protein
MSGKKKSAKGDATPYTLKEIWEAGFFSSERSFDAIQQELNRFGCNPPDNTLRKALSRVSFLTKRGLHTNACYIQRFSSTKIVLNNEILPDELANKLDPEFSTELQDLKLNYGKSGTCTAFLLRKILEKLIFLTFTKNGLEEKLKNGRDFVGLKSMLNLTVAHKVHGKPFLMPKTLKEIEGIKFLGDTSAHNPLVNVSMKTIVPVMPYIITAYSELAMKL